MNLNPAGLNVHKRITI